MGRVTLPVRAFRGDRAQGSTLRGCILGGALVGGDAGVPQRGRGAGAHGGRLQRGSGKPRYFRGERVPELRVERESRIPGCASCPQEGRWQTPKADEAPRNPLTVPAGDAQDSKGWLEPYVMLNRYLRAFYGRLPPKELEALLESVFSSRGVYLYVN
jgi:hypothetical protein